MTKLSALLADLTSGDDDRAEQAALGLARYGDRGLSALQELLRSHDPDARWWAVRALAQWQDVEKITPGLVAALCDESDAVRQCAALALRQRPYPEALLPLIGALSDSDALTARLASNALVLIGEQAVPHLIKILQTGSRPAKLEAARALAEIRDPRAIPALMQALGDNSALVQFWAERALDKLGLGMIYIKPE